MGKVCAVIVAAGKGKRMGAKVNKQFLLLDGKPVLYYTLKAFQCNNLVDEIILACSASEMEFVQENIIDKYEFSKVKKIVSGGLERQESVLRGLRAIEKCDVVLIHDGARPFVSEAMIRKGISFARTYGACACGVKPKDTIKVCDSNGFSVNTPDRNTLFCVQTPQIFKYDLIVDCHERAAREGRLVTDDTMVAEMYGNKVYLYEGSYENIKITTPEDMLLAERILDNGNHGV